VEKNKHVFYKIWDGKRNTFIRLINMLDQRRKNDQTRGGRKVPRVNFKLLQETLESLREKCIHPVCKNVDTQGCSVCFYTLAELCLKKHAMTMVKPHLRWRPEDCCTPSLDERTYGHWLVNESICCHNTQLVVCTGSFSIGQRGIFYLVKSTTSGCSYTQWACILS
jgi:hypothetical protein